MERAKMRWSKDEMEMERRRDSDGTGSEEEMGKRGDGVRIDAAEGEEI